MKISAMPQSLASGLFYRGEKYFRRSLRAMQGLCGRDVYVLPLAHVLQILRVFSFGGAADTSCPDFVVGHWPTYSVTAIFRIRCRTRWLFERRPTAHIALRPGKTNKPVPLAAYVSRLAATRVPGCF